MIIIAENLKKDAFVKFSRNGLAVFTVLTHTNLVAENLSQVIGSPVQAGDSIFSSQQSLSHTRHTW